MNPYAAKTAIPTKKPQEVLFAAGVYEDEETARARTTGGVSEEIARLRSELRGEARALRSRIARPRVPAELLAEIATLRAAVDELLTSPAPKRGDLTASAIRARGIEGPAASALARLAKGKSASGDLTDKLRTALGALLQTSPWPPSLVTKGKTLLALVGPAGVGKTTTAAKLAARARMANKSVALVSCDSFRVGAMEQLGRYAELMEARFHAASTQEELLDILGKEDADLIIVDTSGRPVDPDATEAILGAPELRGPRMKRHVEVLLCVPASIRSADAARVHRDFAAVVPTALAVTKLDETEAPAGIVHAAFATRLPLTTLSTGQRVPEDIEPATLDDVARRLFPGNARAGVGAGVGEATSST